VHKTIDQLGWLLGMRGCRAILHLHPPAQGGRRLSSGRFRSGDPDAAPSANNQHMDDALVTVAEIAELLNAN